ncbi:hypothetical protein LR48_Vigan05g057400 [Vigna angularis]|uniref:Uncharacterized protein n=1 Tax=Phaseolus angularis TaxID=3914 RepID=A0A0L9UJD2_PHAAN|nr:hypothetical protein LR48_Vigan05g057400 [Vigna angularis]
MQPELGLHVHKNEPLETRNLPVSELEAVRFKLKLGTPGVFLRCLNGDRSKELVSFGREKGGLLERRRRKLEYRSMGRRLHAEESGTEVFRKISFLPTSKRASALLLTPASHYLISDPRCLTPGVRAEGFWVRF